MHVRMIILATMVVFCGSAMSLAGEPKQKEETSLTIEWQRLVDAKGETCDRCEGTEKELRRAIALLKRSLKPLEMKVTLEKKSLGPEDVKDIIDSNRILIAGKTLEYWLDAKVGSSACGSCCAKLGATVECRTTTVNGETYEVIPATLIVKAGLKAASEAMIASTKSSCCPKAKCSSARSEKCCSKSGR